MTHRYGNGSRWRVPGILSVDQAAFPANTSVRELYTVLGKEVSANKMGRENCLITIN